jgi:hypothetical protein
MTEIKVPDEKATFLYLGARQLHVAPWKNYAYVELDEKTFNKLEEGRIDPSDFRLFKKPLIPGYMPGATFEMPVERNEKGISVWSSNQYFKGYWHMKDMVAQFQMEHRAAEVYADERRQVEKDKKLDALAPHLEPLYKAYRNTKNAAGRAALLAYIIEKITTY